MLVIAATTINEYRYWSRFDSKMLHTVLVPQVKRARYDIVKQFELNAVPSGTRSYFGKGYYFIKEIGSVFNEKTGRTAYYANALYKVNPEDQFVNEAEFLLYLNPLYNYSSIGRKDIAYEYLIGTTIKIIKPFVVNAITSKGSFTTFNYEWIISKLADDDENLPLNNTEDFNNLDEDTLAFMGL